MEDRKSWQIKDESILEGLISLMELTDEEKNALIRLESS